MMLLRQSARRTKPISYWVFSSLLGVSLWALHFGRAKRFADSSNFPPMNTAFELMFDYGRFIALACMIAAFAIYRTRFRLNTSSLARSPARWIIALNVFITAKLLYYGNLAFFLQAIVVIILSNSLLISALIKLEKEVNRAKANDASVVILALWICGVLIVVANIVALVAYPDSALNEGMRMHGATTNPQALGMQCALVSPAFLFSIYRGGILSLKGMASLALFSGVLVIEYNTGSRMGFAAVCIGLVVFFRDYIAGSKILVGLTASIVFLPLIVLIFPGEITELIHGRFIEGREDTRSEGWSSAWEGFLENPLFGVEPQGEDGRLLFVENFFLAAASTGGIVAAALAVAIIVGIVRVACGLRSAVKRRLLSPGLASFYLAACATLIAVSTFEACLLGIMATHTMIAYMLLSGAAALLSSRPPRVQNRPVGRTHATI